MPDRPWKEGEARTSKMASGLGGWRLGAMHLALLPQYQLIMPTCSPPSPDIHSQVFIGRDLDEATIREGFQECLVQ